MAWGLHFATGSGNGCTLAIAIKYCILHGRLSRCQGHQGIISITWTHKFTKFPYEHVYMRLLIFRCLLFYTQLSFLLFYMCVLRKMYRLLMMRENAVVCIQCKINLASLQQFNRLLRFNFVHPWIGTEATWPAAATAVVSVSSSLSFS